MWFFPTRNRPREAQRLLDACIDTDMYQPGVLVIDGTYSGYENLRVPKNIVVMATHEHLEFCGVLNWCFKTFPNESHYGFISDDCVPRTKHWDIRLTEDNDGWHSTVSNDLLHAPGWWTPGATGGELLRTLGWWAPPGLIHLYIDDVWHYLHAQLGIIQPYPDVIIEEFHFSNNKAPLDKTYERIYRGESYGSKDQAFFRHWVSDPTTDELIRKVKNARL